MCSSKPPKPDPLIGQAAVANTDIAKQQLQMAKQQLEWEKDRAAVEDPLVQGIVKQQIETGNQNAARATDQWNIYQNLFKPVEERMVSDAMNYDSDARKSQMAAEAGADVTKSYAATQNQNLRTMGAMGINPNSGRFAGLANETAIGQAKDTAGAMNMARRNTETQGIALRTGAAQFGRNMPNTGIAADSMALNAGNQAIGGLATNAQMRTNNQMAAQQWFGGASNANSGAANIMQNQYSGQLQAWQQQQQNTMGALQGIGQLAGSGAMAFAM